MPIISYIKKKILKKYLNLYFDNIGHNKIIYNLRSKKKSKQCRETTRMKGVDVQTEGSYDQPITKQLKRKHNSLTNSAPRKKEDR